EIGGARIEVIRSNRVSHGVGLLSERDSVLVVVTAFSDLVAQLEKLEGQLKVTTITGCAVEFNQSHEMRGTDRTARGLGRGIAEGAVEKVGGATRDGQEIGPASGSVVHTGRRHEV